MQKTLKGDIGRRTLMEKQEDIERKRKEMPFCEIKCVISS